MSKIIKRILAYIIDLMIVQLIVIALSNTNAINFQLKNYNNYYNELTTEYNNYIEFKEDLEDFYSDNEQEIEDYNELVKEHPNYSHLLEESFTDSVLDKKEYNSINTKADEIYEEKYIPLQYKIMQNSTVNYAISIIIILIYFVLVNILTKGQTLGKKLFRLQIVKKDGSKANVINYLLRSIIIYDVIYNLAYIIGVYTLNANDFNTLSNIIYTTQPYVQMAILLMMIVRIDGRGLHDFIGNTRVIMLDREGNEIKDEKSAFTMPKITKDNINNQKDELKKESTKTKKKTKIIDTTASETEE